MSGLTPDIKACQRFGCLHTWCDAGLGDAGLGHPSDECHVVFLAQID